MKYLALTAVAVTALISAGSLWIASTRPYQAAVAFAPVMKETIEKTTKECAMGAGYYNEGFVALGGAALLVTCVVALTGFDYLRGER